MKSPGRIKLLAVFTAVLMLNGGMVWAAEKRASISLLHINDVYEISPKRGRGGLAQLQTLLKQQRAAAKNSITTLGGDLISPSIMSGLTKGRQMIEMMNALKVDYAVFGNHEFDFGADILAQHVAASKFKWLGTNVKGPDGKTFTGAEHLSLRRVDALSVGFFGLLTPETRYLSSPGKKARFAPVIASAKAAVKELKAMGADVIIALTHLNLNQDRALAKAVAGIHVILGGHDHDPISILENGTLILKAGYDAHYLAVANIKFEKRKTRRGEKVFMSPQWQFLSTAGIAPDPDLAKKIAVHEKQLDAKLNIAVGKTAVLLDSRRGRIRAEETAMGNLIADALKAQTGADVALSNGGGIRGDRVYEPGSILTRKDILSELPFGNVTVVLQLTGGQLRAALEHGLSQIEHTAGRFLQVSGLSFSYNAKSPAGQRIIKISVGGKALDPAGKYSVATNDYIANGGDGFAVLQRTKRLVDAAGGTLMATMVMDYIKAKGTVAVKVEARIVREN